MRKSSQPNPDSASGSRRRIDGLVAERLVAILAVILRRIHRSICIAEKLLDAHAGNVVGDADAHFCRHSVLTQEEGRTTGTKHPLGENGDSIRIDHVLNEHPELVSPNSSRHVGAAETAQQPLSYLSKQGVARSMPVDIV